MTLCKEHLEIINNSLPEEVANALFKHLASKATNKYYEGLKQFIEQYDETNAIENVLVKFLFQLVIEFYNEIDEPELQGGKGRYLLKFMHQALLNCANDLKEHLADEN